MTGATLLQVALGGAIGSVGRYLSGVAMTSLLGRGFPWGTIFVNILGSFLMGVLIVVLAKKGGAPFAPFFQIGLLGGFTTFSSFSLDALTLYERGQAELAMAYVAGSLILSLGAIALAFWLMRSLLA
ncbi:MULTISPECIES: fluoride efflux transporter CrcB [Rhodovulum]|uniref:Fluoride-specific ion channel FluC n=2 Tax=Rhodovulum TaxID=34008 RepID=A0A8E2VGS8_9RHOB|nr:MULTISPECIES: fluoride efflux transporter CrcB [Rhodovulum]PTW40843.1 CrcB protein [Rhodovulum kholense]RAP39736.1 protein CrcB [Rhodovulum viride]